MRLNCKKRVTVITRVVCKGGGKIRPEPAQTQKLILSPNHAQKKPKFKLDLSVSS